METEMMRAGRAGAILLAVSVIMAVAGCTPSYVAVNDSFPPRGHGLVIPPLREATRTPPLPERKPSVPTRVSLPPAAPAAPGAKPASPPASDATPDAAPEPESGPEPDDFSRLQGLDQDATVALLGEPAQRTESPPARIWHYSSQDCELNVYFYLDLVKDELRVLHYEIKGNDGADQRPQRCYAELVSDRHAGLEPGESPDSSR